MLETNYNVQGLSISGIPFQYNLISFAIGTGEVRRTEVFGIVAAKVGWSISRELTEGCGNVNME